MGLIKSPKPVKLFVGVLTSISEILPEVEARLSSWLGPVDLRSDSFPFDMTRYYDEEMGSPIRRCFLGFSELIKPAAIAEIKVKTNDLEEAAGSLTSRVRRPINLDPGYLEQSKIVLASTKNYYHRILMSCGIYAEVTLHYEGGQWRPFPWTFPDFKHGMYYPFFSALRDRYRDQLRTRTDI